MAFFKSETQTDCGGKGRSMDPTWSFEGKPIKIVSEKMASNGSLVGMCVSCWDFET